MRLRARSKNATGNLPCQVNRNPSLLIPAKSLLPVTEEKPTKWKHFVHIPKLALASANKALPVLSF